MNMDPWSKKDVYPDVTIQRILKILEQINLNVSIVDVNNCDGICCSVSIIANDLPGVYANGKGINYKYAVASGLAEFMERLQTDQLLHGLYPLIPVDSQSPDLALEKFYQEHFSYLFDGLHTPQAALSNNSLFRDSFYSYTELETGKKVMLPDTLIKQLCGSNGTCAGNSSNEALVQGLCEILERYALKRIYYLEDKSEEFPVLDVDCIKNTNSYELLRQITTYGYTYEIKDLTFGGKIPVLGLILFNKSHSRYAYSFGSDLDVDICLQRCITEIFQGVNLDFGFRNNMLAILQDVTFNQRKWNNSNKHKEYIKALKNRSGFLPNTFLFSSNHSTKLPGIFCNIHDSKERFNLIKSIFSENKWKTYIRDCSYLGFSSYRIYSEVVSEAFFINKELFWLEVEVTQYIKEHLCQMEWQNRKTQENLISSLIILSKLPRTGAYFNFSRFLGLIVDDVEETYDLIVLRRLVYLLLIDLKEYQRALEFTLPFSLLLDKESHKNNMRRILCYDKMYGYSGLSRREVPVEIAPLPLPNCPNCDMCALKRFCHREELEVILKHIDLQKRRIINEF